MAIALVASTVKGTAINGGTTDAIDTTGANLIVLAINQYSNVSVTASDSKGNTWTALTARKSAGGFGTTLYYCASPSVGTGHTFTVSGTGAYPNIGVIAVSGAAASPFDLEEGVSAGTTSTSHQPGSLTPSEDNCLVISSNSNGGTSLSINSSFTASTVNNTGGSYVGGGIAYKIQTTAGAENPTWSWTTSTVRASAIASFKAAAGGSSAALLLANAAYFGRQL